MRILSNMAVDISKKTSKDFSAHVQFIFAKHSPSYIQNGVHVEVTAATRLWSGLYAAKYSSGPELQTQAAALTAYVQRPCSFI